VVTGVTVGTASITATSESQAAHTDVTVTAGAAALLAKSSGDAQAAAVAQPLPVPLAVRITDALSNPVPGVQVVFAIRAGGGSLANTSVTSDNSGRAQTTWTLGTSAGADTVTASIAGPPAVLFTATTLPGPASAVVRVSGADQLGVVNTALSVPFVSRVTDQYGNGVAGVSVTWSLTLGTGSLSATSASSDAAGLVSVRLTMGARAGTRTVAATLGAAASVSFSAIAAAPGVRDDWPTYGHDAGRTGASQASVPGALTVAWRYDPAAANGSGFSRTEHPLARADAVFLEWAGQSTFVANFTAGPAVDRISPSGQQVWSWHGGNDTELGTWGSIWSSSAGERFVYNNDGFGYLDFATGVLRSPWNCDRWGESLADGPALYLANDFTIDCGGPYVGSFDASGNASWYASPAAGRATYVQTSSVVLMNGVLSYSARFFSATADPGSGVFAYDPQTGALLRSVKTIPASHMSADATQLYQYEGGTQLVARAQSDLHVVWTASLANGGEQAPVLANDLVIVATTTNIQAFRASTGAGAWTAPIAGAAAEFNRYPSTGATMAAALGSGTLVVTNQESGIHVLSLADGRELSHLVIPTLTNRLRNPIIVNDPIRGAVVYAVDDRGLIAFTPVLRRRARTAAAGTRQLAGSGQPGRHSPGTAEIPGLVTRSVQRGRSAGRTPNAVGAKEAVAAYGVDRARRGSISPQAPTAARIARVSWRPAR
ncbi:MAG: Ig-like domain-containing protein, partial [Gemmatimonadota bacterium]|nr:Ig-like domain-containing protein [Gemmatimonadota bacterium]